MNNLYYENLIPNIFLDKCVMKLIFKKSGTIIDVFQEVALEVAKENLFELYTYTYELEGYINDIIRNNDNIAYLSDMIMLSTRDYLVENLMVNVYSIMIENITKMLDENGYGELIGSINFYSELGYIDGNSNIRKIRNHFLRLAKYYT